MGLMKFPPEGEQNLWEHYFLFVFVRKVAIILDLMLYGPLLYSCFLLNLVIKNDHIVKTALNWFQLVL